MSTPRLMAVLAPLSAAIVCATVSADPIATATLPNGCQVSVDWPSPVTPGRPQTATVTLSAPAGKSISRALVLFAINEAAGCYVPASPPSATATTQSGTQQTLSAALSPSWALWPTAAFTDGLAPPVPGIVLSKVLGSDRATMLPSPGKAVPFERPDEYDWATLLFAADDPSTAPKAVTFSLPMVVDRPDAAVYLWTAAAGAGLPAAAAYVPANLASRPAAQPPAAAPGRLTVTQPRDGQRVGTSVDIVGHATPGALIIVWTEVYKQKTGEFVDRVPGIRHKTAADGSFHFRIATPRIFMGPETPLVYKIKVKQVTAAGESQPVTITVYPQRQP